MLTRITPALWYQIKRFRDKIDATRARRAETKAEGRAALEYEVEKYTERLNVYYTLIYPQNIVFEEQACGTGHSAFSAAAANAGSKRMWSWT